MKNVMWELLNRPEGSKRLLIALSLMSAKYCDSIEWLNPSRTMVQMDDVAFTQKGTTLYLERKGRIIKVDASAVLTHHSLEEVVLCMQRHCLQPNPKTYKIYELDGEQVYTADFALDILIHHALAGNGLSGNQKDIPTANPWLKLDIEWLGDRRVTYTLHSMGHSIVRWHIDLDAVIHTTVGKLSGPNALPFYATEKLPEGSVYIGESDVWGFGHA